jgi:hypothetical protein
LCLLNQKFKRDCAPALHTRDYNLGLWMICSTVFTFHSR